MGHTHTDEFYIESSFDQPHQPVGVSQVVPSLGTHSFKNPSFRVYKVSPDFTLLDYDQYRLFLNQNNPNWTIDYSFKNFFNVSSMGVLDFKKIALKMKTNNELYRKLIIIKYANGPLGPENLKKRGNENKVNIIR